MIGEKLCFAIVFAAEAMIAWLYLEYILSRKNPLPISICSFGIGYATLFAFSLLDSTTINAITFCGINYFFRLAMEASRKCNADSKRFVQSAENRLAEFFFAFRALSCRCWNCSFIDVLAFKASFLGTFRRTDSACSRLNAFAFPQDFKVIFQF